MSEMFSIEIDKISDHCRTCFISFHGESSRNDYGGDKLENTSIDINSNESIKSLIEKFIDGEPIENLKGFPQHICLKCYDKLQAFDDFCKNARANAQRLRALYKGGGLRFTKTEIADAKVEEQISGDNFYNEKTAEISPESDLGDAFSSNSETSEDEILSTVKYNLSSAAVFDKNVHVQHMDIKRPFRCLECHKSFSVLKNLERHRKEWHTGGKVATKKQQIEKSDSADDFSSNSDTSEADFARAKTVKCNYSLESLPSASELDKHVRDQHLNDRRPFKCLECHKSFSVLSNLERHRKEWHTGEKKGTAKQQIETVKSESINDFSMSCEMNKDEFACESTVKCNYSLESLPSASELDKHVRNQHLNDNRPFKCLECHKSFSVLSNLERHKKEWHTEKKDSKDIKKLEENTAREFKCEICEKSYQSKKSLYKHKYSKHSSKRLTCKQCQISFDTQKALNAHNSSEHPSTAFVCEQCGGTYPSLYCLKVHIKTKHPTEEDLVERKNRQLFECPHCKKAYQSKFNLKFHIQEKHSDNKPFECEVCGKRFAVKHVYTLHTKIHIAREKIPCHICGKLISNRYELSLHVKAIHMKLRPFKCKYCEQCFSYRKSLRNHEFTHTGEKPYVCKICGVSYRQLSCLRNHSKTHEQIKYTNEEFLQPAETEHV